MLGNGWISERHGLRLLPPQNFLPLLGGTCAGGGGGLSTQNPNKSSQTASTYTALLLWWNHSTAELINQLTDMTV